ncbi:MAG: radical SAM protein [Oscillospiraceae bacterium]|nr:radical SAM protein [Oscillospiraceae bacterium]
MRKTEAQIRAEGKSLIPWEAWLELAKELKEAGTLYILLTGGEPFLYPNFRKLYEALHSMGFLIMINTNGTLIDKETLQWLKDMSPQRINLTLYGASPETYRRICGNPNGYERAMKTLHALREAGIPTVVNASMIPENAEDLEALVEIGKSLGLNTRVTTYMFPPVRRDAETTDSRFTPEESAKMFLRKSIAQHGTEHCIHQFRQRIAEVQEQSGEDWGDCMDEFMRCRAGRSSFWVSWDGTMSACGLMTFPKSYQVFDGKPVMEKWLELTDCVRRTTVLEGCKNCALREVCKPCAATVYAETGSINEKAPYLCKLARSTMDEVTKYLEEHT